MMSPWLMKVFSSVAVVSLLASAASACPFCDKPEPSLAQQIADMDVTVIARVVSKNPADTTPDTPWLATFEIVETIDGAELVGPRRRIEAIHFGKAKKGGEFLIMASNAPDLMWSRPRSVSPRARAYVKQLTGLAEKGPDRLDFFEDYLDDQDALLSQDAYDEFARAPYEEIREFKDRIDRQRLIRWIANPDIVVSRRRLYFTMLGVCGTATELPLLRKLMQSGERREKEGLDAMIAAYLTITGPAGLPLIDKTFLGNAQADYVDTNAAISALRFLAERDEVISRRRVLKSLKLVLDRPELADLVVPDFQKWEDWTVMDKLVELFKQADPKSPWIRVPVVTYLRHCPLEKAKNHIVELEKIDAESVRRSRQFFPLSTGSGAQSAD